MGWNNRGHGHTESDITDLGAYPDATGQASGKVAETDGSDGWTFIDTPSGGGGASELPAWAQDNVAASQTDVALTLLGNGRETVRVLADGDLTAVLLESTEARTAGTCTVTVQVNGVDTALTATLDGTNTEWHKGTGTVAVSEGDEVGVVVTTDGTWSPTTAEITVRVQFGSSGGGGGTTWLDPVPSGNAPGGSDDDEFDDDTIDANFTQVTPTGTATWTEGRDVLSVAFRSQATNDAAAILKPVTLSPGAVIETAVRLMTRHESFSMVGLVFADGATAAANAVFINIFSGTAAPYLAASMRAGTIGNINSEPGGSTNLLFPIGGWGYQRLTYVSANTWRAEWSPDGVSWSSLGVADQSVTLTPTHVGLWVSSWGGTAVGRVASFEYLRIS